MQWMPYEVMERVFRALGYTPSPEQAAVHRALLELSGTTDLPQPTLVVLGGGLQAGKSWFVAHHILGRYMLDEITWLVGRNYDDCVREYEYVRNIAVEHGIADRGQCSYAKDPPPGGWEMRFSNGHLLRTISSDDATHLHAEAPDAIYLCEPGRQDYEAFLTAWDRVLPNQGTLALCGTFERAAGWYRSLWKECQGDNEFSGVSLSLPSYANRRYCPEGADTAWFVAERIRASQTLAGKARFDERFLGIPQIPHDMVFYDFSRPLHVRNSADFDSSSPVYLAVDPGIQFANVVLFIQVINRQIRVFDEIYLSQVKNRDVINMVKQHYAFPNVEKVVFDPYGGTQRAMGQDSVIETWEENLSGRNIYLSHPKDPKPLIADRLNRVHDFLGHNFELNQPGLIYHPRAKNAILELEGWVDDEGIERGYRYRLTDRGEIASETPIPRDDHAASAIGYFIIEHLGYKDRERSKLPPNTSGRSAFSVLDRNPYAAAAGRSAVRTGAPR